MIAAVTSSLLLSTLVAGTGKQEPGVPPPPPSAIAARDAAQAWWQAWATKHKYRFASTRPRAPTPRFAGPGAPATCSA